MFIVYKHKHMMRFIRREHKPWNRYYYLFRCDNYDGIDCPYHRRFAHSISIKRFWR